ncbi:response regulator [Acuticoccus kandeliae]|uniref:response regulator n=1 Tax=Acuticoccus kandeliae TaxID=2073160 RepID=UPI001300B09D|nr:response regulator [Acuticoccus kandeliae]
MSATPAATAGDAVAASPAPQGRHAPRKGDAAARRPAPSQDPAPCAELGLLLGDIATLLSHTIGRHIVTRQSAAAGLWAAGCGAIPVEDAILAVTLDAIAAADDPDATHRIEATNAPIEPTSEAARLGIPPGDYVRVDVRTEAPPRPGARAIPPSARHLIAIGAAFALYPAHTHGLGHSLFLPRALEATPSSITASEPVRETILLVEDDDAVRHYTRHALTSQGYAVIDAVSGPHALDVLESAERIDLLLTDLILPGGVNGKQLADAVRAGRPNIPVLFTSGFADERIGDDLDLDPFSLLLPKPYRREELTTKVREALRSPSGAIN